MSTTKDQLTLDQRTLLEAWLERIPQLLNKSDKVEVNTDEADPRAIRIMIETEGHSKYSFDFKCTYVDSREVKVELVDVERDGRTVDENTEIIQGLIKDYIRHIHECAQGLQAMTHY